MQKRDVEVRQVDSDTGHEFSDNFYINCAFCEKLVKITPVNFHSCSNLGNNSYCPFCLRNKFNYRDNHNVLILSFRGIIGYYYHRMYRTKPTKLWVSQIEDMIEKHVEIGLSNPILSYDPSTFLWFADFNRIGSYKHKVPFDEIQVTLEQIFDTFDVQGNISLYAETNIWKRFDEAFKLFYKQRKRPKDKKKLIPTFAQIITSNLDNEDFHEQTRNFTKISLMIR